MSTSKECTVKLITLWNDHNLAAFHVAVHDAFRDETSPAQSADVWPFAGMGSFVNPQWGSLGKTFSAVSANVRFFSGVDPFVLFQLLFSGEMFRAYFTTVGFVTRMDPSVKLQFLLAGQAFAAYVAQH